MNARGEAGFRGKDVRSDCWVAIEPRPSGGIGLQVRSKVDAMYGASIREDVLRVLGALGIANAAVELEDAGALPFVIAARVEAAAFRAIPELGKEFRLPLSAASQGPTRRDRFRRSRLYLPGNDPKLALNAGLHTPDGIILDLEDSVAPAQKDAARILVRNALATVDFGQAERMVRINQGERGLLDLDAVIPQNVHVVLIPKVERAEDIAQVERRIEAIRSREGLPHPVYLMPILESASGILRALEIATASPSIVALAIGLEDYTADIGAPRSREGTESLWARSMVVNAARAAGVQPIDSVYSDVADLDGLREAARASKALGFEGMGCIHPRQIRVIHEAMAPTAEALERAKRIVRVYEEAEARGLGVVSLGSKMIDPPVVKRAIQTVTLAVATGMLPADWREREVGS